MRAAVIDIGSNSIKLVIGENDGDQIKIIDFLKNVIGIGKSTFYRGRISQEITNQVVKVIENYKRVIEEYAIPLSEVRVIATTAVREAENRSIFIDTILRKTGFKVEVLNVGDVIYYIDVFLSYKLKKAYPFNDKNVLIIEVGGGSVDISVKEKGFTLMNLGMPIGMLKLNQFRSRIDGSKKEVNLAIEEYVESEILLFKQGFRDVQFDDIILIDESYSNNIHKILPNKNRPGHFFQFKFREANQLSAKVAELNSDEIVSQYDIPVDIADSIDSYAIIVKSLFKLIKTRHIYILEASLPEALLAQLIFKVEIAQKFNRTNQLISLAKFLGRKFNSDMKHMNQVANLCEELFSNFKDIIGLQETDRLYLILAAYLHKIGLLVNNRGYHKISEYLISFMELFQLTEQEGKMIACIARYHRKAIPQKSHYMYAALPFDMQILTQKLSALLRIASALDSSYKQKVKKLEIAGTGTQEISLVVFTNSDFSLEKMNFSDVKNLFEDVSGSRIKLIVKKKVG